jgi:hypothetical protein
MMGKVLDAKTGGTVELILSKQGSEKARCELEMELLDTSGSKVPLASPSQRKLSFKDELRTVQDLVPEGTLLPGSYSLDVTVIHEGVKDRTMLRDLVMVMDHNKVTAETADEDKGAIVAVRRFEAHPASAFSGETVTITLECTLPEVGPDRIVPHIKVGRTDVLGLDMPKLDASGISRTLFVLGPDEPGGDIPCELVLSDGDRTLVREIFPRFINIKRSSELELIIRTALDLGEQGKGPLSGLLLQGERPVLREGTGELTVWTLNSGRHLLAIDDRVLGRADDAAADRT